MVDKRSGEALRLSEDKILEFISLYAKEECLWKTDSKFYTNKTARSISTHKIAKNLGVPDFEAKHVMVKIRNLRNSYCQELKKMASSIALGGEHRPKLVWFTLLDSFLRNYVKKPSFDDETELKMRELLDEIQANNDVYNQISKNVKKNKVKKNSNNNVNNHVNNNLNNTTKSYVTSNINSSVTNYVTNDVNCNVNDYITNNVDSSVNDFVTTNVDSSVTDFITNNVDSSVTDFITTNVTTSVNNYVTNDVTTSLTDYVTTDVTTSLNDFVTNNVDSSVNVTDYVTNNVTTNVNDYVTNNVDSSVNVNDYVTNNVNASVNEYVTNNVNTSVNSYVNNQVNSSVNSNVGNIINNNIPVVVVNPVPVPEEEDWYVIDEAESLEDMCSEEDLSAISTSDILEPFEHLNKRPREEERVDPLPLTKDYFDDFGQYISSLLRALPKKRAMALQPQIINMITTAALEEE